MDANTNPGTQTGLRQPDFATVANISRDFAGQMERYRNLPEVQDGTQWAELSGPMGAFKDNKIQCLDANIQRLGAKVDDRMGALETNIINKLDTFMALMTARSTEMDEKFVKCNKK
ncbi:hypothetical protein E4U59_007511 [Claviceps monticola]|nr:hypothetical protein E4U59_007511 [Claviceps monticola]